jgi:uncharacterized protein (TIGR03437 family)
MQVAGGNQESVGEGLERLPGESNYYFGNDPEKWRRNVPHFARVRFDDVYPGIDVVYYDAARKQGSNADQLLEYDFIVEPGADPDRIRLRFEGIDEVSVDEGGALRLRTPAGDVRQYRPVVYQQIAQMCKPVGGHYAMWGDAGVRFELDPYDPAHTLVIDPKVEYSTYLGGSGNDQAFAIDVGPDGSVYIGGWTESPDFGAGGPKGFGGGRDGFLTRADSELQTSIIQNFFGGGGGTNEVFSIRVDRDGNAYITGNTDDVFFPRTDGSQRSGGIDAFAAVVSSDGDLLFSGLVGSPGRDTATGIDFFREEDFALVLNGGVTDGLNFPVTTDALKSERTGATDGWLNVYRLDTTAGVPFTVDDQSTSLLGGNGTDFVDALSFSKVSLNLGFRFDENDVAAAMTTNSDDLSWVTPRGPFMTRVGGTDGHFSILRLDPTASPMFGAPDDVVAFGTYLPGGPDDESEVSFDTLAGQHDFTLGGPFRKKDKVYFFYNGGRDIPTDEGVFMEEHPGGQALVMSFLEFDPVPTFRTTYAGGPDFNQAARMAVDPNGAPAGVGLTFGPVTTTPGAPFRNFNGAFGGYLLLFSPDLTQIDFGTYMWGNTNSNVTDVAFDDSGQIHIAGINGTGALTTPNAFQPDFGGGPWDATVARITQPFVSNITPVNAGSFQPGVTPRMLAAIGGKNLGPDPGASFVPVDGIVPTEVGGTRVLADGEPNTVTFASNLQVNSQFRFTVGFRFLREKGEEPPVVNVQVEFEGDLSNVVEAPLLEANPGLFAFDGSGQGQGAILNPDFSINSADNPAPGDSFIVLYGTGGGVTDPECPDLGFGPSEEPLPRLTLPVQVFVDGVEADVPYAGSAPGLVCGVDQYNVAPTNNPSGPAVPIQACVNDVCSNIVTAAFN